MQFTKSKIKYNNFPLGLHKSFNYQVNTNKHTKIKTQSDPDVFVTTS